ncbi:hypothetical protein LMG28614_05957 [Paraburkholderia ultramafica]|uniref:Uncharacterized protein n=1 Tax=Paraburkholderia ultramafica TaxID=1544867 RepID=A0A6S7DFJ9_9BURK|nr:hypothetical protein [Paraburkholderia ultramafica]CAB3804102.1 hypothetical protein LMG28614_05957 [Paraburkholderia ultramafica]
MRFAFRIDLISIAPCAALASAEFTAPVSPDETKRAGTEPGHLAGNVISTPADAASVNDISVDDQMLSRQRGGAVGMVMVAARPQPLPSNSGGRVTLWDEIAPPSPLPIPVDAARTAQGNVAMCQKKVARTNS